MRIIFLNTWNGRQKKQIEKFLNGERDKTDIFCFQEAEEEMQKVCGEILKDFKKVKKSKFITKEITYNNATYLNKRINVLETDFILLKNKNIGLGLYTKIKNGDQVINVINCHGLAYPGDKLDNEPRLTQSKEIINFSKRLKEPVIIGGDFNLEFKTESVKMFENNGFSNLIKNFDIKTTRNEVSWSKYPSQKKQLFADFVFTKGVKIKNFTVPDSNYSDHLAMFLTI